MYITTSYKGNIIFLYNTSDFVELILDEILCLSNISPMVHWAQLFPLRSCGSANEDETLCLPGQRYSPVLPHFLLLFNPNYVSLCPT